MALNDAGSPKNRDPVDIFLIGVAFALMISYLGALWWYVIN